MLKLGRYPAKKSSRATWMKGSKISCSADSPCRSFQFWQDHLESPKKGLCIVHWSSRGANGWHMSIRRILNGFPKARKRYFIFLKRYLFRTFNNITSNRKKGTFFALLRASLPTAKKVPFSRFWEHCFQVLVLLMRSLEGDKRYLFRALNHRLVKWEMDEKWTILTSKYFHSKA